MRLITFDQVKTIYSLGQAEAQKVCNAANYKRVYVTDDKKNTRWKYDSVEIAMIVRRLKTSLGEVERVADAPKS